MGCLGNLRTRAADAAERRMASWGWSVPARDYAWHAWGLFVEQLAAVIPISVLQVR